MMMLRRIFLPGSLSPEETALPTETADPDSTTEHDGRAGGEDDEVEAQPEDGRTATCQGASGADALGADTIGSDSAEQAFQVDMSEALPGPLGAGGRPGYLCIYWAGKQRVHVRHWGDFNGWRPQDITLPPVVNIKPGTPVYALSRPHDYNGVVWPGEGKLHHVYQDADAWGIWKNDTIFAYGMKPGIPLAAAGRPDYMSIWWAGDHKVSRMHWGAHNNWTARINYVPIDVPISPGTKMYGMSMSYGYDGVVWAGEGKIHHLYHAHPDWGSFKYDVFAQEGITNSTPLAACGRPGFLGIFWAGESKVHLLRITEQGSWQPEHLVLPPQVPVVPGMPLYAMCRDSEYNGVVWTGFGATHHLYEDLQAWGEWKYHDLTMWKESELDRFGYDPLMDTSVHQEMRWKLPSSPSEWILTLATLLLFRYLGGRCSGGSPAAL